MRKRQKRVVTPLPKVPNDRQTYLNFTQEEQKLNQPQERQLPKFIEEELQINFHTYSSDIQKEVTYILVDLLKFPSNQLAQRHRYANKLGCSDIQETESKINSQIAIILQHDHKHDYCEDCGLVIQQKQIPVCTEFHKFPTVGIAAYLLFQKLKSIILLIIILGAIYSGYALYININQPSSVLGLDNYSIKLSYASQILHTSTNSSLHLVIQIEGWLMVATVLIWWIILYIVKLFNIKHERMIDQQTITAADFSVMIENIPISYTQEQLQRQFSLYYEQISQHLSFKKQINKIKPFIIKKISKAIPFHLMEDQHFDEQLEDIQDKLRSKKQLFASWIEQIKQNGIFSESKEKRQNEYHNYLNLKTEIKQQRQLKATKMKQLHRNNDQDIRTTVFVSFTASQSANIIIEMNPQNFSDKIRYVLSCCQNALYFKINNQSNESLNIVVSKAPEPEDIIWENIGVSFQSIILRKLLTYFILLLLLGGSFGIVYVLTMLQMNDNSNQILSIAVSLSITVINIIIGVVIRKLTLYQKDFTVTKHQISLSIKSIAAQLMNSILVPVITNIYIEKNIYEVNGLIYDVFYLALTNAFLPPLIKIIDPEYIMIRLLAWWKKRPYSKMTLTQKQLNSYCEEKVYELGVSYVYFVNMFYFTCFYITMHPSIVIFTTIGFFCMYWAEKYSLLSRSKRPTPSSSLLEDAMGQLISFGPCVISMGILTWYNLLPPNDSDFGNISYISHLVSAGLSLLFFIFPFNSVLDAMCHVPEDQMLDYDTSRLKLTSQYDRLNPATMEQGIADFLIYLKNHEKQQKVNANQMIEILVKKAGVNIASVEQKPAINQLALNPKMQTLSQLPIMNKPLHGSSHSIIIESLQNESENVRDQQQSTDKIIIRNDSLSRKANRRRNTQQIDSTPKKSIIFDDLKGYNHSYIQNNRASLDSKNPYSHLSFQI